MCTPSLACVIRSSWCSLLGGFKNNTYQFFGGDRVDSLREGDMLALIVLLVLVPPQRSKQYSFAAGIAYTRAEVW